MRRRKEGKDGRVREGEKGGRDREKGKMRKGGEAELWQVRAGLRGGSGMACTRLEGRADVGGGWVDPAREVGIGM